ncbi:ABC transporter [Caldimonas brevitalea]|uniref:ABC transporter n=1 Tax=Caldimonas brevitalea TaxID=413882 RepID=A0A0G3BXJ9_9BURK|nr:ABC transporter [Caldimonas brevitalea]
MVRREWRRLRGDFWDLGMLTWIPLSVCALCWWIFSAGVARDVPIAVIDQDRSALSRSLVRMLDESPGIAVVAQARSQAEAMQLLRERRAFGTLWIPDDLQQQAVAGRSATVHWFYNGQFSAHVGALTRDVRTVVTAFSGGIELAAREKRGSSTPQARQQFEPIRLQLATLFNENANYEAFLALAVIPSMLQIFIALAAVTAIGRELKAGSVPQWLAAAGQRWSTAVAGKLLIPALAFFAQSLLFVLFFAGVRGWAIEGSALAVLVGLLLLVAAYLGVGTLMIAATLSLRAALSVAAFVTAPAFAFSGQGFPLLAMPPLARGWAEALPLTHYLQLQSRHWLAGAPFGYGFGEMAVLAGTTVLTGGLGLWLLQRRAPRATAWGRL